MKFLMISIAITAALVATSAKGVLLTTDTLPSAKVVDFSQFNSQIDVSATSTQIGQLVGEDVVGVTAGSARMGPQTHWVDTNGQWNRSGVGHGDQDGSIALPGKT